MPPPTATISDRTAREVIRGLLALAILIWAGVFGLEFKTGHVDPSIIVAATGITGGLVGLVSLRHGPDNSSSVDAPAAQSVTVIQPGAVPSPPPANTLPNAGDDGNG